MKVFCGVGWRWDEGCGGKGEGGEGGVGDDG